jgi:hypothetical protein
MTSYSGKKTENSAACETRFDAAFIISTQAENVHLTNAIYISLKIWLV